MFLSSARQYLRKAKVSNPHCDPTCIVHTIRFGTKDSCSHENPAPICSGINTGTLDLPRPESADTGVWQIGLAVFHTVLIFHAGGKHIEL